MTALIDSLISVPLDPFRLGVCVVVHNCRVVPWCPSSLAKLGSKSNNFDL